MMELKADTTIVVLGASGDLAKKKTVGFPFSDNDLLFLIFIFWKGRHLVHEADSVNSIPPSSVL